MRLLAAVLSAYIGLFLGGLSGVPQAGASVDPPAASAGQQAAR
jgi:hypothetical protein